MSNFNDNWSAFIHPVIPPSLDFTLDGPRNPQCNTSTTYTGAVRNTSAVSADDPVVVIDLPAGVTYTPGSTTSNPAGVFGEPTALPVDGGTRLTFVGTRGIAAGETISLGFGAGLPCPACTADSAIAIRGYARSQAAGVQTAASEVLVTPLPVAARNEVRDMWALCVFADGAYRTYGGFKVTGAQGSPTFRVLRAVSPNGPYAAVGTAYALPNVPGSWEFDDADRTCGAAYWYKIRVEEPGCNREYGQIFAQCPADQSSGNNNGLESNGRLASALAERAMAQAEPARWNRLMAEKMRSIGRFKTTLKAAGISDLAPDTGPGLSGPTTVTPGDLPELTNARTVFAADYYDADNVRRAGLLMIETKGELYEHSRQVCERARGSRILGAEQATAYDCTVGQFGLVRAAYVLERERVAEHAITFQLYVNENGGRPVYRVRSFWQRKAYPRPGPDETVLDVQLWSSTPGYDQALTDLFFENLSKIGTVEFQREGADIPPAFLTAAATPGGSLQFNVADADNVFGGALRVRATYVDEAGETKTDTFTPDANGAFETRLPPFLDATLDLVDPTGAVIDSAWLSDGAFAKYYDGIWEETSTRVDAFDTKGCLPPEARDTADDDVVLAGCATIKASRIGDFAGVGRYIGGAKAPLNLNDYKALRVWIRSDRPVAVCLGSRTSAGEGRGCRNVPAAPGGAWVTIALADLAFRQDGDRAGLRATDILSFTAGSGGDVQMTVGGVYLTKRVLASSAGFRRASGCTAGGLGAGLAASLAALAAALARRRRG